jgi:hypothetical protein
MVQLNYSQHISDGAEFFFRPQEFLGTYRGLSFSKAPENQLYFVVAPEGKMLPAELGCRFTKITLLERAVDDWIATHPECNLPDAPLPPQPPRSHHKKPDNSNAVATNEDFNAEENTNNNQA